MADKISRRNFLTTFGLGAGAAAASIFNLTIIPTENMAIKRMEESYDPERGLLIRSLARIKSSKAKYHKHRSA
ncbi:MAG: twin-arginine translocation signal domain-containing protein [Patescibacteria group bacterium]